MLISIVVFGVAFLGIVTLFAFKKREVTTGRIVAPRVRDIADSYAMDIKFFAMNSRARLEQLPPVAVTLGRTAVREAALTFASLARYGERQAHKLADMVSHKHRFERRAPRSEFLRRVSERGGNSSANNVDETGQSNTVERSG